MRTDPLARNAHDELEWLLRNLEIQIDDHKLENDGANITFYWDTSIVRSAILGMAAFYDAQSQFRSEEFSSRNTLVASLAAAGWLGTIELLQPHRTELLNLIGIDFGIRDGLVPPGGLSQFLRDVGLDRDHSFGAFGEANSAQIAKIVQQQAGSAEKLFKAVQAISGTWELRLVSWFKSKRIKFATDQDFDVDMALSSDLFRKLRDYFESWRRDHSINNFTDALAICYLQHRLRLFKDGKTKILPKFFASSPILAGLASAGVDQDFLFYPANGRKYSALCDPDYYVFRAAFHPPEKLAARADSRYSVADLGPLAEELRERVDGAGELPPEILAESSTDDKRISELIRELRQFWFLDHVWLPYAASEEFTDAAKEHVRVAHELATDQGFKRRVKQTLEAITGSFQRNVTEDNWSRRLFLQLEHVIEGKRKQHLAAGGESIDIFRVFGLLRFGIPAPMHPAVQQVFKLFLSSDKSTENAALGQVLKAFRSGLRKANTPDLAVVLSVLWVYDLDEYLDYFLTSRRRSFSPEEPWVLVFHAAALLRMNQRHSKGQDILREIEERFTKARGAKEKAMFAIGIAYLYFHLWIDRGGEAQWRRSKEGLSPTRSGNLDRFVDSAISYAKYAHEHIREDAKTKAYAINQYLYYLIEGANDDKFGEAKSIANALLTFKTNRAVWQYRYDDTLARYYHRLGEISLLREFIEAAKESCCGDPAVLQYYALVVNEHKNAARK